MSGCARRIRSSKPVPQPDARLRDFEAQRPRLLRLAYRMLGSVAEAEDIVQDAWIRWQDVDAREVRQPGASCRAR